MAALFKLIGNVIVIVSYVALMAASLALGLIGGAFVSVFLSFKHYFSALHEEIGG